MKIYFDNIDFSSRSGPNTFASRLAKAISNNGHVLADRDDYDVALVFIEPSRHVFNNKKKPYVLRLDGIWFAPNEFETKNIGIKSAYYEANGVVFQSQFDADFIIKHWDEPTKHSIINNGIDLVHVHNVISLNKINGTLQQLRSQYETICVSSANWHGQKRLGSNYEMFRHIREDLNKNACLIVMGSNPTECQFKHLKPHVFYTGNIKHEECLQIYGASDYMLHLAYLDHCPNSVCESLACGCPVICSEDGGTQELLHGFGTTLQECKKYDNELLYYDKPPIIDVNQLKTLPKFTQEQFETARSFLDINVVAEQYIKLFKKVK